MGALHSSAARANRARQVQHHIAGQRAWARKQFFRLGAGQLVLQLGALAGNDARRVHQENQLFGFQRDRGRHRDVLERQIENLAGWRITERRQQDELVVIEAIAYASDIDLAHLTGMHEINTLDNPDRLGGHKIAARHADVGARHRRIGQCNRQQCLDLYAHAAARLFRARQSDIVGDAQAPHETRAVFQFFQARLDLRPRAMHQHQAHAQARQQIQIVYEREKPRIRHDLAAKRDDEGAAAKRVYVRRGGTEPFDEIGGGGKRHENMSMPL